MVLYLIENDKTIDGLLASPSYREGRDVIICFNYLVLLRMRRETGKHTAVFLEELLDSDDYRKLHAVTDEFAMTWYRMGDEDRSLFEGTSFGMITENMFPRRYMLNLLVKIGEVVRKAAERWQEAEALYCDFTNRGNTQRYWEGESEYFFNKIRTIELVGRQLGLPVHLLETPSAIPPMWVLRMKKASLKTRLKARLKELLFLGVNTVGVLSRITHKRYVFIFGYYNLQKLQTGKSKRLITDNYKVFKHSPRLLLSGSRLLDIGSLPVASHPAADEFLRNLHLHVSSDEYWSNPVLFTFNGISYCELYRPVIMDLVQAVIPRLLQAMQQLRASIRKYNIEKVVFIDTIDTISRIRIQACRQEGCTTLVVYHGLFDDVTEQEVIKRRIPPDSLVMPGDPVYSPQYLDNFLSPPQHTLVNFGSPIIDQYPPSERKRVKAIKKILFLTMNEGFYCNMSRFPYQEQYLGEILSTFAPLMKMGMEVYYRPHPGENPGYNEYLFDFFGVDRNAIHYSDSGSFSELIRDMDLMVTNISTAFFESQAAGVPTIFLDPYFTPEAVQPPLNGINGEEVLRIATGNELLDIIKRNQHDPKELNRFLDTFLEKYAPRYVGPLDGQAGKRIAEYIAGTLTA